VYTFSGLPSIEYPILSGCWSFNRINGVAEGLTVVRVNVEPGSAVEVSGTGVGDACGARFVSGAINLGRCRDVSMGTVVGLEIEKPGVN
jgi:hypothetical protein